MKINVNADIQCFIIWKNARHKEQEILDLIRQDFDILKIYHVNWSPDKFGENLSAFYGDNFIYNRMQRQIRGEGEFVFVLAQTKDPVYEIRKTNRGPVSVNIKSFDLKQKVRQEWLGNFSFHASNNMQETKHATVLILGKSLQDVCASEKFDGAVKVINQDIPCVRGYKNLREFFYVLNETCNYAVLRGFDALPDTHTYEKNGDIDLLVDDMKKFLALVNPKIRTDLNAFHFFNWENMGDGNPNILIHPKFVGDNYYDINMQKKILETRVLNKNGIYVPNDEMYFWSLLHHGVFHKENWQKYDDVFKRIASKIGVKYKSDKRYLCHLMTNYMLKNGYKVAKHLDKDAAALQRKNIKSRRILKKGDVFYTYRNACSMIVFHEKAIYYNPELVTKFISGYDIFIDLERHVLDKKSPVYRYVLRGFKKNKELCWKFVNRMTDVSCLSYRRDSVFNRVFLSGRKISESKHLIYTEERNVPHINGKNLDDKLLEKYTDAGKESFLDEISKYIDVLFNDFRHPTNDMLLTCSAWDMLPKNCFDQDGKLIFFDKEASCKYPLTKSLMLANLFFDFNHRFWFSREERYEFYRFFIEKYRLPDQFAEAEQRRVPECQEVLQAKNIRFKRKLSLALLPRWKKALYKNVFRLMSHIAYTDTRRHYYKNKYRALCAMSDSKRLKVHDILMKHLYRLLSHITFGAKKQYYHAQYRNYFQKAKIINIENGTFSVDYNVFDETGAVPFCPSGLIVNVKGPNNKIIIDRTNQFFNGGKMFITINGSDNLVFIGAGNLIYGNSYITIGGDDRHKVKNVKVTIEKGNRFSNFRFFTVNSNTTLTIGNDCMFSDRIDLHHTDNHPIYDLKTGKIANVVKDMKIGNNVWIGEDVTILKNVTIPDGCIIGKFSVVGDKNLTETNCVIAGNPAKVVKHGVTWSPYDPAFVENKREDI